MDQLNVPDNDENEANSECAENDWDRNYYLNHPWLENLIQLMIVSTIEAVYWILCSIWIYEFRTYNRLLFWSFYMVPFSLIFFTLFFSSLQIPLLNMTIGASRALRFIISAALFAFLTYELFYSHGYSSFHGFYFDSTAHSLLALTPLILFGLYIPCYLFRAQITSLFTCTRRFVHYMHHRAL